MRFITLTTLSNQTVLITPRAAGQVVRLGATEVTAQALTPVRLYGTGTLEISEGYWDRVAVVDGNYTSPYFDGNTIAGSDTENYAWSGETNNSPSYYETRASSGSPSAVAKIKRGPWVGGQGNSGCRFAQPPSYVVNGSTNGGQVGFSATFVEVGANVYG